MINDQGSDLRAGTRRQFLQANLAGAAALGALGDQGVRSAPADAVPWFRRTFRWGQTNITEKDPVRYDIAWWREYWKATEIQGVIINAGGIVAYYPSRYPLQHQAEFLQGRDLYGELAKAAHEDGLVVLARMDSNRAAEDFYHRHPDWFAVDASGAPYRAADKYISCIHSAYYDEYLPDVLREIIERSHPEGFADNSWSGLSRDHICYCRNCSSKFRAATGEELPAGADWDSPVYREWIRWNYNRRLEVWDLNNRVVQLAGGPHCLWIGMNSGSIANQSMQFRDYKGICKRAEMILLDHQSRSDAGGFQQNAEMGKLIHNILGWDKLIPESMAMYQAGRPTFRVASKPPAEARMWMAAGFAGGIQPWWHMVGAYHEDRRMYRTAGPMMRFYKDHQEFLVDRKPVAAVGVVWSQDSTDFYGRDRANELTELPYRGIVQALVRARIPYVPVNVEDIEREPGRIPVLALPNVGALSVEDCERVRRFVEQGGSLLATGCTSLYTESGETLPDFGLAQLFGAHVADPAAGKAGRDPSREVHTYLRLSPELRAKGYGPKIGGEPVAEGSRHPVLQGFDETDILPFGGTLLPLRVDAGATVPLTYIPPFPIYPPETAWMREEKTSVPGLILRTLGAGGRVAYLPADLDRRFAQDNLPDHGNLLANILRWLAGDRMPLTVRGPGLIDCHLYEQPGRLVLHVLNLTNSATWRAPIDDLIPLGPYRVSLRRPGGATFKDVRFLNSGQHAPLRVNGSEMEFEIGPIMEHEVAVIS